MGLAKAYGYLLFKEACRVSAYSESRMVVPLDPTLETAKFFNLDGYKVLMQFLAEDGFDCLRYHDTQTLGKNFQSEKVYVDSYHFLSGLKTGVIGYLAFFKFRTRDVWSLKSFHRDRNGLVKIEGKEIVLNGDPNE